MIKSKIEGMKYVMKKGKTPGWWVFTDKENGIVIKFQEHKFNDTQQVVMLEECSLSAQQIAGILREMGDWVVRHHADKVF